MSFHISAPEATNNRAANDTNEVEPVVELVALRLGAADDFDQKVNIVSDEGVVSSARFLQAVHRVGETLESLFQQRLVRL